MANIADDITELVGNTPLLRLHKFEKEAGFEGKILAKLEVFNPTGSVKDRIAKNMIEQAERDGRLKPGGTIIEATSGNTGIGLAAIAAAKRYQAVIVMPDSMSKERIRILEAYGAKVVLTPGEKNMGGANEKAAEILEQTENAIITGQGGNPSNPEAHYQTTGPEIWKDTGENVDIFVATVGTGGTISGTGKFLKEKNPDIQIIGVEPAGCPVLSGGEAGPHSKTDMRHSLQDWKQWIRDWKIRDSYSVITLQTVTSACIQHLQDSITATQETSDHASTDW